jgi:hypothetical protein
MSASADTAQGATAQGATALGVTGRSGAVPRRRPARRYLPPQHGAWAMLLLPWLAGVLTAGFRWLQLPLLLAWLTGYLLSYYLFLAVKTRRPGRVRAQLLVYAAPTVLVGGLVLALRPDLLWYAPAYALLLAINVGYAARRNERSLLNDLAAVLQSCLMVFVCATVAAVPPVGAVVAFVLVTAYFTGTVLHVKTMIRERGNARYRWASIGYHLAAFVGMLWIGPVAVGVFALLLLRASVLPGRRITPVRIGVIEIAASLLVLLAVTVS